MHYAPPLNLGHILKVAGCLPPGPRILAELRELLLDSNSDTEAITSLLRRDGPLTARLVRIANSIAFRRGSPVGSLDEAVLRIGFQQVYGLMGIASMSQVLEMPLKLYPLTSKALRENALLTALLMEELAPLAGEDARLAYTAGLLSSIGKIALDITAQVTSHHDQPAPFEPADIIAWEYEVFGLTSTDAAAHILRAWRFPVEVFGAIRDHRFDSLTTEPIPMARLLHRAGAAVAEAGRGLPGEQIVWTRHAAKVREELALGDDEVSAAAVRAGARFEELKSALG